MLYGAVECARAREGPYWYPWQLIITMLCVCSAISRCLDEALLSLCTAYNICACCVYIYCHNVPANRLCNYDAYLGSSLH